MTDYTKEAEELYPSEYRNSADVYNKADLADAKQEAHIAARQQSAAEIDRLRGEVERLKDLINTVAGDFFAAGLRRAKSKNPETLNLVDYKEYYFKQNNIQ